MRQGNRVIVLEISIRYENAHCGELLDRIRQILASFVFRLVQLAFKRLREGGSFRSPNFGSRRCPYK